MKVALLGYGDEGKISYDYYHGLGAEITICDENKELTDVPTDVQTQLGEQYLQDLDRFDIIVRTAGMPPSKILAVNPTVVGKITTNVNEFLRVCPTKNVIGVTGTKGKGTTSTLIARILETAGHKVCLGGNIGLPPLSFLSAIEKDSWVVLELSSFQLIDLQYSPHIAVILMVVPEHLNWHINMAEYTDAKAQLFARQTSDDIAIYFDRSDQSREIASAGEGQKIPYYAPPGAWVDGNTITIDGQEICSTHELKLLGAHNWQNACAAITTVWQIGMHDTDAIRSVLASFSGLEHRLEHVREVNNVHYYDDSFGTTPETAIVALQAFAQPKVIILGGSDKGARYDELARTVATTKVHKVLLIGDQAAKIQVALEKAGFTDFIPGGNTMTEIVTKAQSVARDGDIVLLSTACASFDMFTNYKDRGNQFKEAVRALQ
jgi:UDP-N-acetylmuramoylalanine--D-glutamate ligase